MEFSADFVGLFIKALSKRTNINLRRSPIMTSFEDDRGSFEANYVFHKGGALRIEVSGDKIESVSVWNKIGDLSKPDYQIDFGGGEAKAEINLVGNLMAGLGKEMVDRSRKSLFDGPHISNEVKPFIPANYANQSTQPAPTIQPDDDEFSRDDTNEDLPFLAQNIKEGAQENIDEFMKTVGVFGAEKPLETLFNSYEPWAEINGRKKISQSYFFDLVKEWKFKNKYGSYTKVSVTEGSSGKETIFVDEDDSKQFISSIINNENLFAIRVAEIVAEKMLEFDPSINSALIHGVSGSHKIELVNKVLDPEDNPEVVYINQDFYGIAGLLKALFYNRRGKLLIFTGMDKLLAKSTPKVRRIMKELMTTEKTVRIISLNDEDTKEEKDE